MLMEIKSFEGLFFTRLFKFMVMKYKDFNEIILFFSFFLFLFTDYIYCCPRSFEGNYVLVSRNTEMYVCMYEAIGIIAKPLYREGLRTHTHMPFSVFFSTDIGALHRAPTEGPS